jgi:aryl-alcohol dehydrogenase-like predicted oxidoreductase
MPGHHSNRRQFLECSAAALAAALAAKPCAADAAAPGIWRNRQPGMAYRRLGRTNYMISEVACGGNTISPSNYNHVQLAIDMGLNYLDTAPAYGRGRSEEGYALTIAGAARERVFLATKVSPWADNRNTLFQQIFDSLPEPERKKLLAEAAADIEKRRAAEPDYFCDYFDSQRRDLERAALSNVMERRFGDRIERRKNYRDIVVESVESSLRRLKTDYLDLLHCPHGASSAEEVLRFPEIFDSFEALKKAGKVRHLGVSAHSDPAGVLKAAVQAKVYSAVMIAYNVVNHAYIDPALADAERADVGVIAMKVARPVHPGRNNAPPVSPARLAKLEKAVPGPLKVPQKAYLWALRNPRIAAVNSELVNAGMVKDNLPLAGTK